MVTAWGGNLRICSDSNTHMLFVDAGNIFNSSCGATQANCYKPELGELRYSVGLGATWLSGFGPITFIICVMGGLGNMVGGFIAAFIFSELITIGGYFAEIEWGYVLAFVFFIVMMFIRPEGLFARKS